MPFLIGELTFGVPGVVMSMGSVLMVAGESGVEMSRLMLLNVDVLANGVLGVPSGMTEVDTFPISAI